MRPTLGEVAVILALVPQFVALFSVIFHRYRDIFGADSLLDEYYSLCILSVAAMFAAPFVMVGALARIQADEPTPPKTQQWWRKWTILFLLSLPFASGFVSFPVAVLAPVLLLGITFFAVAFWHERDTIAEAFVSNWLWVSWFGGGVSFVFLLLAVLMQFGPPAEATTWFLASLTFAAGVLPVVFVLIYGKRLGLTVDGFQCRLKWLEPAASAAIPFALAVFLIWGWSEAEICTISDAVIVIVFCLFIHVLLSLALSAPVGGSVLAFMAALAFYIVFLSGSGIAIIAVLVLANWSMSRTCETVSLAGDRLSDWVKWGVSVPFLVWAYHVAPGPYVSVIEPASWLPYFAPFLVLCGVTLLVSWRRRDELRSEARERQLVRLGFVTLLMTVSCYQSMSTLESALWGVYGNDWMKTMRPVHVSRDVYEYAEKNPENLFPPLSPKAGQLMHVPDALRSFRTKDGFLYEPGVLWSYLPLNDPMELRQANEAIRKDTRRIDSIDDRGLFYLGYEVKDDETLLAFAEAYRKTVTEGGNFEGDLFVERGDGQTPLRIRRLSLAIRREGDEPREQRFPPPPNLLYRYPLLIQRIDPATAKEGVVVYADRSVEVLPYPGPWPMTETTVKALLEMDRLGDVGRAGRTDR